MSDFFDISKDDLIMPPSFLNFEPGSEVVLTIEDFKQDNKNGKLTLTCRVNSNEHEGQQHLMVIRKSHKRSFVNFINAFFNKDDVLAGNIKPSSLIGRTFQCVASDFREYNGREYQDLVNIKDLGTNDESEPVADF